MRGVALQSGPKPGGPTCRLGRGSCNTRTLGASSARTKGVRYNVVACYRSQVRLASHRTRLEIEGNSRDKVVWSGGQVHKANKTHAKTVHALQVFDKMPQALRLFLEWPNLPDQCLFGCTRGW